MSLAEITSDVVQKRVKRRLAAILSADVVGYTRLVREDEAGTIFALKYVRENLIDPLIAAHAGRTVKLMGDGALVEFASVVDAVDCAIDIQRSLADFDAERPEREPIVFRIGVNLGDVIIDGDDIYGDGVNIAARLESLAEPGGICLSSLVKESLGSRMTETFVDRGHVELKNLEEPIRVWAWKPDSRGEAVPPAAMNGRSEKPVIAVLPFDNMGGCPEESYFSEGISEDIITELSKFHSISVVARHSSFAFAGQKLTIPEIARRLKANYVVEGSVRRMGSRLRLVAQLIEAESGKHLWAEHFDQETEAIFEIEDRIVSRIAGMLESSLLQEELSHSSRSMPTGAKPYDLWLQARKMMEAWTPEEDRKAEELLKRAVSLDPNFARGHGGLAGIYNTRILLLPGIDEAAALLERGFDHARRAVELDPNDARNHIDLAWSYMLAGKVRQGEKHFNLARKLNPNDASILTACSLGKAFLGDPAEGEQLAERAMELNPLFPDYYLGNLAFIQFIGGNYEAALATIEHAPKALPELSAWRAAALGQLGRTGEAREAADELRASISAIWAGQDPMTDADLVRWLLSINAFARDSDRQRLVDGLREAGLNG